jgi:hypothetical protein
MKKKLVDIHAQYIPNKTSIKDYLHFAKTHNFSTIILTPACVNGEEPEKTKLLYWIQRRLLSFNITRFFVKIISKTFYNKNDELKIFWKLFTRQNKKFDKIIIPNNENLLKDISNFENLKMWLWINPSVNKHNNLKYIESLCSNKNIIGLKFHLYWHNFDPSLIKKYEQIAINFDLPFYLFLNFDEKKIFQVIDELNDSIKIIIGYCGFPFFDKIWNKFKNKSNIYYDISSAHIDSHVVSNCLNEINFTKLIFGSDCPMFFKDINGNFDYYSCLERFNNTISRHKFEHITSFENAKMIIPRLNF